MTSKKALSERDICTKFILPAIVNAGWDSDRQIREEVFFTDGRIFVKGQETRRGERKRADFILYQKPNIPVAVIEAKDNNHSIRSGIQQALDYACVFRAKANHHSKANQTTVPMQSKPAFRSKQPPLFWGIEADPC